MITSALFSDGYGLRPDGLTGPYVVHSYANSKSSSWELKAFYQKAIKKVRIYALCGINGHRQKYEGLKQQATGYWEQLAADYFFLNNAYACMQYEARHDVLTTPQSLSTTDTDYIWIQVGKQFWGNRLGIALRYNPPLHLTSGKSLTTLASLPWYALHGATTNSATTIKSFCT